jgi:hypothetical protein
MLYMDGREHNVKCWSGCNQAPSNQNNYFMSFSPHNADLYANETEQSWRIIQANKGRTEVGRLISPPTTWDRKSVV